MLHRYCHFQMHIVHVQIFHYRRSKCLPCIVKHDAALLSSDPCTFKASYNTRLYEVFALFWFTEHVSKMWSLFFFQKHPV